MNNKKTPLVSIITAAYNRSNVLKLAIQSVLNQNYKNWELIVVNDASTDDTSDVVRSFDDSRIHLIELKENSGDQSGPNNIGIEYAKGEYISYLSQDDLWFPDHLKVLVEKIIKTNSDWVFSMGFNIINQSKINMRGIFPSDQYNPLYGYVVASLWLLKRSVLEKIGGWKMHFETRLIPSQDLLIRAFKVKKIIRAVNNPSVLLFPSGLKVNSYADRQESEQRYYWERIESNSGLKEEILNKVIVDEHKKYILNTFDIYFAFRRFFLALLRSSMKIFKLNPVVVTAFLKHRRKGSFINKIRITRGLPPLTLK